MYRGSRRIGRRIRTINQEIMRLVSMNEVNVFGRIFYQMSFVVIAVFNLLFWLNKFSNVHSCGVCVRLEKIVKFG